MTNTIKTPGSTAHVDYNNGKFGYDSQFGYLQATYYKRWRTQSNVLKLKIRLHKTQWQEQQDGQERERVKEA